MEKILSEASEKIETFCDSFKKKLNDEEAARNETRKENSRCTTYILFRCKYIFFYFYMCGYCISQTFDIFRRV